MDVPKKHYRMMNRRESKLYDTPIYKIIRAFVERGGILKAKGESRILRIEEERAVENVAFNLGINFEKALVSPDHWRIFLIKPLDIWHNFQSIEFVGREKLLRGRIAAGLTDWMGWHTLRSELVEMMAQDVDMTRPY